MPLPLVLALAACQDTMPRLHFNEPPSAPVVRVTPDVAITVDTLLVEIEAESVDPEGDAFEYRYTWFKDGVEWVGRSPIVDGAQTTKGEVWEVVVVANDGEWDSEPGTARAEIVNAPPVATLVALEPAAPRTGDDLAIQVDGEDLDGDAVTWLVDWTVDGQARPDLVNLTAIPAAETSAAETWTASVRPYDGQDPGEATTLSAYIDNTPPEIAAVRFSPPTVGAADDVTAYVQGLADVDGHDVTVDYTWYVDGAQVQADVGTNGIAVLAGPFVKGQEIEAIAVPNDGFAAGDPVDAVVVVANTPPNLGDVALSPTVGTESTSFVCTPSGASDVDGDDVAYDYAWYVNGAFESGSSDTLTGSHFRKGDEIVCEVVATDGEDDGGAVTSNPAEVINSAPTLVSVTLSPSSPTESSTISATLSGGTDADGDALTYAYAWTVGGAAIGATGTSITGSSFARGDVVAVTVTPNDGTVSGAAVTSASVTVANSPPTLSSASIAPTNPTTDDDLTVSVSGWSDADGDSEGYTYQWYRNGAAIVSATSATLAASATTRGDRIHCVVTPDDGYASGSAVTTPTVNVLNSTPSADATVDGDTSSLEECDEIQLDAGSSDDADADTLAYTWALSSKPSASRRTSADIVDTTDAAPTFLLDAAGTFTFSVSVDDGYVSASDTVSVTVSERATNSAPVADAGTDMATSGFATCNNNGYTYVCGTCTGTTFTLDGSSSYDDDEDPLTYVWTTSSSYATIADSAAETTTLTVANLPSTYGETTTYEFSVRLRTIDCAGGASEDYVTFEFDCTGI